MSDNEPQIDIYLSKSEVSMILVGLNFSLERHYQQYDAELPEELTYLTARLMDEMKKFKYCYDCKTHYALKWWTDNHECPLKEEE